MLNEKIKTQLKNLVEKFTSDLVTILSSDEAEKPKTRGMGALSPARRSETAKKAALTRKRRAAGRKAAETRRKNNINED